MKFTVFQFCTPKQLFNFFTTLDQKMVLFVCLFVVAPERNDETTPTSTKDIMFLCFSSVVITCTGNPCKNGATCKYQGEGEYSCDCPKGYIGNHCEIGKCYLTTDPINTVVFLYS